MSEHILIESVERVLRIEINRPDKKNALTRDMYTAMADAINQGEQDPSIRVIVIHGKEEFFTAGNDLKDFQNFSKPDDNTQVGDFMISVINAKKPIIVAVSGFAIGIGTTMLLQCALVYAGENAKFRLPFVNLGVVPEFGSSFLLPRLVGHHRAAELFFYADFFGAEKAYEIGLVNKIFPTESLIENTMTLAKELASKPPASVRLTKSLLKKNISKIAEKTMINEGMLFAERLRSPEAAEAFRAFFEKRKPDFSKFS